VTLMIPNERVNFCLTEIQREFVLRAIAWLRLHDYDQVGCECPRCDHCGGGRSGRELMHRLASLLPEANGVSQGDLGDTFPFRFIPKYRIAKCPAIVLQEARCFHVELLDVWDDVCRMFQEESNEDPFAVEGIAS
jgi:hypothetical protein